MGADGFLGSEKLSGFAVDTIAQPTPDIARAEAAANAFGAEHPQHSARLPATRAQKRMMAIVLGLGAAGTLIFPAAMLLLLAGVLLASFALILGWRTLLVASAVMRLRRRSEPLTAPAILPTYTILIALKNEAASMPALSQSMMALDYPEDRLDLKLLLETGDDATRDAILAEIWPT